MKHWLHKIEVFVDKIIPFLLVILIAVIVGEIWFHEFMVKYHTAVQVLDWIIVAFFVVDLIFKYLRIRNIPKFLRASWLDIVAVFPFFLVFRFFEGIAIFFGAGETAITQAQKVTHLGIEGERVTKEVSRSERLARFLRPIARGVRLTKLGNPEVREETKKDLKEAEKEGKIVLKDVEKEGKKFVKEVEDMPRVVKAAIFYEKPKIIKHISEKLNKPGKEKKIR